MEFKPAQRKRAKLRLGIAGPSGSGKTYSALIIANGMAPWSKIAVIDSENGSAELYAHLGDYSVLTLEEPYAPEKYIDAIRTAELSGFEVIIIDSLSHAWNGEGGILDQQGKAAETKYKGNSWAAWREFAPKHNALVEAILKSPNHIIATLRSKTEYAQVSEDGKIVVRKIGLAPIQRDGLEYEFSVFLDLSTEHIATTSKDRTSIFDGQYFKPDGETGRKLLAWLNCESGTRTVKEAVNEPVTSQQSSTAKSQYRILNSEAKIKPGGQVYARVTLQGEEGRIVTWSNAPEILDVPSGSTINAKLSQQNGATIIESYSLVEGGEAA
jgi:hypothetical protein